MAPSGQSTTIAHPSPTCEEQLSLLCGTTFCVPHPDRGQKAQQKQRCSSSKPVNTVQVGRDFELPHFGAGMGQVCTRSGAPSLENHAPQDLVPTTENGTEPLAVVSAAPDQ